MATFDRDPTPKPEDGSAEPDSPGSEHYRLFIVDSADKFRGVHVFLSVSEAEALERARSVLEHHPYAAAIEVWKRGVLVGRIDR